MTRHQPMKPYVIYYDEGYAEGDGFFDFDTEEERQAKYEELINNMDTDTLIYIMDIKQFAHKNKITEEIKILDIK